MLISMLIFAQSYGLIPFIVAAIFVVANCGFYKL